MIQSESSVSERGPIAWHQNAQAGPLHPVELETVQALADGLSYEQIAQLRNRSVSTVRSTISRINLALGVSSSQQSVIICYRNGWLDDHDEHYLVRLAAATEELTLLVKAGSDLTAQQRAYLTAFDELIYARTDDEHITARVTLDAALSPTLGDELLDSPKRDLVELLASYVENTALP
jgi:DNA-binding CsgD family transcriptional regulator